MATDHAGASDEVIAELNDEVVSEHKPTDTVLVVHNAQHGIVSRIKEAKDDHPDVLPENLRLSNLDDD